jgi:hypothetical protein
MGTLLYALLYTFRRRNNPDAPYRHFGGGEQPNARGEPHPMAGAQRRLLGVGSSALFGPDSGRGSVHGWAPSLMAPRASDSASRVHDDLRSADDLVRLEQDLRW